MAAHRTCVTLSGHERFTSAAGSSRRRHRSRRRRPQRGGARGLLERDPERGQRRAEDRGVRRLDASRRGIAGICDGLRPRPTPLRQRAQARPPRRPDGARRGDRGARGRGARRGGSSPSRSGGGSASSSAPAGAGSSSSRRSSASTTSDDPKGVSLYTIPSVDARDPLERAVDALRPARARRHVISTGCTSSTDAIGHAMSLIRYGARRPRPRRGAPTRRSAPGIMTGFCLMQIMSTALERRRPRRASRPFSQGPRRLRPRRRGRGCFVLEEMETALARGACDLRRDRRVRRDVRGVPPRAPRRKRRGAGARDAAGARGRRARPRRTSTTSTYHGTVDRS